MFSYAHILTHKLQEFTPCLCDDHQGKRVMEFFTKSYQMLAIPIEADSRLTEPMDLAVMDEEFHEKRAREIFSS